MAANPSAESAVRSYLEYLADPTSAIDGDEVARAEARFSEAKDQIERLHAAASLEKAKAGNAERIEAGFIAHARAYADAEGIPVEAFRALEVEDRVLAEAGFQVSPTRRRAAAQTRRKAPRSPQVSLSTLKAAVSDMPKRFTLAQLAERAGGGSPATVRKAVQELIDAGMVVSIGPDPTHSGVGRAPTLYEQR